MLGRLCTYSATLGPIGFLPAPGTMATIETIIILFLLSPLLSAHNYFIALAIMIGGGWLVIAGALKYGNYTKRDPSEIVLDEVIGTMITFSVVPFTMRWVIIGFLLFRFFDIIKPFGIARIEKIGGATGIILDDVVAGSVSAGILFFIKHYN